MNCGPACFTGAGHTYGRLCLHTPHGAFRAAPNPEAQPEPFVLYFCDVEGDGELVPIRAERDIELLFRAFNDVQGNNNTDWRFDGDGFHTDNDFELFGRKGGFLITRL